MKRYLLVFSSLIFCGSLFLRAQTSDRFVYAMTDAQANSGNWSHLRVLDLQTGKYSQVLLNGYDMNMVCYDAATRKPLETPFTHARYGQWAHAPFATHVAAMAYDRKNNRLYYTPMFIDQLRYIDLNNMKVYYVTDKNFINQEAKAADQSNIITRMVIASDGYGYALTNDGMHLVRFSTGKKTTLTHLGALVDDPANKGVSVHNSCTSYGGDMIADDEGHLYLFTARNHVFKINPETKVATHLGAIKGLPSGFTVNGASVTPENKVLVASATLGGSYYTVDLKTLESAPFVLQETALQTSDLANGNLYASGNRTQHQQTEVSARPLVNNRSIKVYPNPVTQGQVFIQFDADAAGEYSVMVTDVAGRQVIQRNVIIGTDNQLQKIEFDNSISKGVYLLKVLDAGKQTAYSNKLVIQ
ncbi:MAG: T9SS type A sorting domain-containing protein [Chitinophagaceae bacterium]|nr:T9SS type A sorting domain-containing protein [Chitinophagaceae bacterium]